MPSISQLRNVLCVCSVNWILGERITNLLITIIIHCFNVRSHAPACTDFEGNNQKNLAQIFLTQCITKLYCTINKHSFHAIFSFSSCFPAKAVASNVIRIRTLHKAKQISYSILIVCTFTHISYLAYNNVLNVVPKRHSLRAQWLIFRCRATPHIRHTHIYLSLTPPMHEPMSQTKKRPTAK